MGISSQLVDMAQIELRQDAAPLFDDSQEQQFVAFKLGEEEYAVDILMVQEIIRSTHITRVPKAPVFITGVLNLRGVVVPVIDSHIRFSLPQKDETEDSRIIVFKVEDTTVGMTIDNVTEVLKLPVKDIERPTAANGVENEFIKGIGKIKDRLLIILDVMKMLSIEL